MLTDNKFANERKCLNSITTDYDGVIIDGVKASIMNPNMDCYTRLYQQDIRVIFYNNFCSLIGKISIAPVLQACLQAPQPMHFNAFKTGGLPFSLIIACTGQA